MVTRVLDGGNVAVGGLSVSGLFRRAAEWRQADDLARETVSTGFPSLDTLLPAGGVRRGSLLEWLAGGVERLAGDGDAAAGDAGGVVALACAVACRLAGPRWGDQSPASPASAIVVVDRGQRFYPPAVMPWLDALAEAPGRGSGRPHLVVARPSRDDDELWAIDQALRCPGVAAVLAWPRRVHATAMRRWHLAARTSGAVGLLVRGLSERVAAGEPTWADAKLAVSPVALAEPAADLAVRRLRIARAGGPWAGNEMLEERSVELLLDLANGREATRRHRLSARPALPLAAGNFQADHFQAGRFPAEEAACRAS